MSNNPFSTGQFNVTPPTLTDGQVAVVQLDNHGNVKTVGTNTPSTPTTPTFIGIVDDSGNTHAGRSDAQGDLGVFIANEPIVTIKDVDGNPVVYDGVVHTSVDVPVAITDSDGQPIISTNGSLNVNLTNPTASPAFIMVEGMAASGAPVSGNPVLIAGTGSGLTNTIYANTTGTQSIASNRTQIDGFSNSAISYTLDGAVGGGNPGIFATAPWVFNGTNWDRARDAGVGNNVPSTGLGAQVPYGQYNPSLPVITSGQYTALQTDTNGRLITAPIGGTGPQGFQSVAVDGQGGVVLSPANEIAYLLQLILFEMRAMRAAIVTLAVDGGKYNPNDFEPMNQGFEVTSQNISN